LGVNKEVANELLIKNYNLSREQAENILVYTHPSDPTPYVVVTPDRFLGMGKEIFKFGEWDFNKNNGSNITYSYKKFTISNDSLNTTNGLKMDMNNGNVTWNNKTPYKLITITDNLISKRIIDNDSDFIVILLMDDNRAIVIDKNYENSLFIKLLIEQRNTTNFEIIYKTNSTSIWKIKN